MGLLPGLGGGWLTTIQRPSRGRHRPLAILVDRGCHSVSSTGELTTGWVAVATSELNRSLLGVVASRTPLAQEALY